MIALDAQRFDAALFDLDGVITDTAVVHAEAWRQMFDAFLSERSRREGEEHRPFSRDDYLTHVDGKPRHDGVRAFLASRGIELPVGDPSDAGERETVHGLGNRKDRYFNERLQDGGVAVFDSTVALVRELQAAGVATAVFSASRNCLTVLEAAGLDGLFAVRVDGEVAEELDLAGKPDPAMLLEAARRLGAEPQRTLVVEDAQAGVEAGRRGDFGLVVGVDRAGRADELRAHGADVVVSDLAEMEVRTDGRRRLSAVPDADVAFDQLRGVLAQHRPVVLLDFDGTLAVIVDDPDDARPVDGARETIEALRSVCPVAVISGRDVGDVGDRVGVDGIWYAGSHGFEACGPHGEHEELGAARGALPALDAAERSLRRRLEQVPGVIVERKGFSLAVHYRQVPSERVDEVTGAVDEVVAEHQDLRSSGGRQVAEVRPDLDWHKGRVVSWLLDRLDLGPDALAVYAGDDLTDEDAFAVVHDGGLGIVVRSDEGGDRLTAAHVAVDGPHELVALLERIARHLGAREDVA